MPIYEYACNACGQHTEVQQSFSDPPLEKCEQCGGRLRRVFHPVGVMFKGSGFYSTDAKSSSTKTANGQSSDSKGGDGKAASKGTEASGASPGGSTSASKDSPKSGSSPSHGSASP